MKSKRPFNASSDTTPKYTIKDVVEMVGLSAHTIRYYDNIGLIPFLDRTDGNIRMFSEHTINWLQLVHCLRTTNMPIEQVKNYIQMCLKGDSTIQDRAEMIFTQEKNLRADISNLQEQLKVLAHKKKHYQRLIENKENDSCNPMNQIKKTEPTIIP